MARSFGAPAVTAECGVGFLETGGVLLVSEPPGGEAARWDARGLRALGFDGPRIVTAGETSGAELRLTAPVGSRWPRRTGVPERRPLWG